MPIMVENNKIKLLSPIQIKRIYCENNIVYSSGNKVYYHVINKLYEREVDGGEDILDFVPPSSTEFTFLGWSDDVNSTDILTDKVMEDEIINLYAVVSFSNKTVTIPTTALYFTYSNKTTNSPLTLLSDVDCYMYYAASVYLSGSVEGVGSTGTCDVYFAGGGGSVHVGHGYGDKSRPITAQTYTVNFAQNDGETNIVLHGSGSGYGYAFYIVPSTPLTLYGRTTTSKQVLSEEVTLKAYRGQQLIYEETKTRYFTDNIIVNPTFTIPDPVPSDDMIFRGWTDDIDNGIDTKWDSINDTPFSVSTTIYALESLPNISTTWDKFVSPCQWDSHAKYTSGNAIYYDPHGITNPDQTLIWNACTWDSGTNNGGTPHYGDYILKENIDCSLYSGILLPLVGGINTRYNDKGAQTVTLRGGGSSKVIASVPANTKGPSWDSTFNLHFTQKTGMTNVIFNSSGPSNVYQKGDCSVTGDPTLIYRPTVM